ncbi:MAG: sigma-54-dependent Fis family transcriptional regulator, partial [Gammaproteobacteria bacterium]|nr:sigma-54-dependent Fis family transcriptional regulator [Gammaproteobacteria bacterium]
MTEDKILIIDDERLVRWPLTKKLAMEGYTPIEADTGKEGLKVLMAGVVDLILLDLRLPDLDGVEVLRRIKEIEPEIAVIMMTGFGSVESAVEAMKLGAFDFIRKPFNPEELLRIIGKALEVTALKREVRSLRLLSEQKNKEQNIIGQSPLMKKVGSLVDVVGQADMANVLLLGESGTGK